MTLRTPAIALLAAVVLAGCTGFPADAGEPTSQPATTVSNAPTTSLPSTTRTASLPSTTRTASLPSDATAKTRALETERHRIERTVSNTTGVEDLAFSPTGGPQEARVTKRTRDGVIVDVVMSIGYQTECLGGDDTVSHVDGHRVRTTYLVTDTGTRLRTVAEPLPDGC